LVDYVTSHLGQLSLDISPWVGAMGSSLRATGRRARNLTEEENPAGGEQDTKVD